MAAAMTMQPPSIGPPSNSLSTPPIAISRFTTGFGPAVSQSYSPAGSSHKGGGGDQCDGCRNRNSRCAINFASNKCYSCDFHRQDCVFTPHTSRKRSYPQPSSTAGRKSFHASDKSLSSSFKDLFQSSMLGGSEHESSYVAPIPHRAAGNSACYRYLRGTTYLDPLLLENVPFDDKNEASLRASKFRKIGSGAGQFIEILSSNTTDEARNGSVSARLLESLRLADQDLLFQSYFDVVHPVFPILDQPALCASYDRRSVEPVLLAAICVVSGAWLQSSRRVSTELNMSATEAILREHLRDSQDRPSMTTLQAGLLLTQCPNHTSRNLLSQLIALAFDLGIHQDCSQWKMDVEEKLLRRRLAWALYAQDKWTSLMHGRPAQLTESNCIVRELSEEDFDIAKSAEDQSKSIRRHGACLFMQMLVLSQILAEILETFYTLSAEAQVHASAHNALRVVLARAKPVQIKLKDWFSSLPAQLKMDAPDENQAAYNGVLHLAYFATEIALHRCIIRASAVPGTEPYLAHICRSAAKTRLISAMDFVNRLRPSHFKCSWPLASVQNFGLIGSFGVLLRATCPAKEEAGFYCARLEEFRWTLSVSNRHADFLESAIRLLDDSTELLQYIPEKPEITELVSMNPHVPETNGQQGSAFKIAQERSSEAFTGFSSPSTSTTSEEDVEGTESV
ncbi:hypothetical protein EPUS_02163 [Endocarpon pusillum Z07020]|uniref:Xylanolytic transcriptional activator regulatory domain-containing protein n=1 Tax=Endocarpon pusillum (strain Z07020 / HMAS-L-300199) TaxID=1263415 RepID=U1GK91_ENDPU|nr:uncharacterized protein EPUS_02163 [Endocarpon pusillum Z07020]ERF72276.1 hypothetical protein EPUS_02163 [Endocarpon pusillum Z07020]